MGCKIRCFFPFSFFSELKSVIRFKELHVMQICLVGPRLERGVFVVNAQACQD